MKPMALIPRSVMERKPAHGKPCNRCGACCMATVCPIGQRILHRGPAGPCPALVKSAEPGEYQCGLVADPAWIAPEETAIHGEAAMREAALVLIGSGTGCDARFNGEPADQEFYKQLDEHDHRTFEQQREARRLWRIG
jgi:hypothetical protein